MIAVDQHTLFTIYQLIWLFKENVTKNVTKTPQKKQNKKPTNKQHQIQIPKKTTSKTKNQPKKETTQNNPKNHPPKKLHFLTNSFQLRNTEVLARFLYGPRF